MITELRSTLVEDLRSVGLPVFEAWPDRVTPPCLFVTPPASDDYVTSGENFTEYMVSLDVVILVAHATAGVALTALDTILELVITNTADWRLIGCDSPSLVTISGNEYLGTIVHLSKYAGL